MNGHEIFIPVLNFSTKDYVVKKFEKLPFQIVVVPVVSQFRYIDPESYETATKHAKRGAACLGSSDVPSVDKFIQDAARTAQSANLLPAESLLSPMSGYL